jgi:hypothetical protein
MKNDTPWKAEFWPSDRITQVVFIPILTNPLKEIQHSPTTTTARGTKGFGSTGVNNVRQELKKSMKLEHKDASQEKHAYQLGSKLTIRQKEEVRYLMHQYEDVLAVTFNEIKGAKTQYKHLIDTGSSKPVKQAPYRLAPHYQQWVKEEVKQLLKSGIIRPSKSPWASPIVIVPKKDGVEGENRGQTHYGKCSEGWETL